MDRPPRQHAWVSQYGLTALLLLISMMMSWVVFEQARTIESQRQLIHQLFRDSLELTHIKVQRLAHDRR